MNPYAPLIVLLIILVVGALVSHLWVSDPRWKNLIFGVCATVTVVVLLLWILKVLGVWHGAII